MSGELFVFGGPSIDGLEHLTEGCRIYPPVRRGDLDLLRDKVAPSNAIIFDGLFGSSMSVTGTECRQLLEAGWRLFGASSMGALRAAELYSVGMHGLGVIHDMLRAGIVNDDSELAVAYRPDSYDEISISLIQIRFALIEMLSAGHSIELAREIFSASKGIYFLDRTIFGLHKRWLEIGISEKVVSEISDALNDKSKHPKRRDAEYALTLLTRNTLFDDGGPYETTGNYHR